MMWADRAAFSSTTAFLTSLEKVRKGWGRESNHHWLMLCCLFSIMTFTSLIFITVSICASPDTARYSSTRQSSSTDEDDSGERSHTDIHSPIRHGGKCHHGITGWFFSQPDLSWIWRIIEMVSHFFLLRQMRNLSVFFYFSTVLWVLLFLISGASSTFTQGLYFSTILRDLRVIVLCHFIRLLHSSSEGNAALYFLLHYMCLSALVSSFFADWDLTYTTISMQNAVLEI